MATLDEAFTALGTSAALGAGLRTLTLNEAIPFSLYVRKVLPLDGYVFWLKAKTIKVRGALHITNIRQQLEDETGTINRVIFTTQKEIEQFNDVSPGTIWVGDRDGLRFAFAESGPFFRTAATFHYSGEALNPPMASQLIDVGAQLSDRTLIVSNSLPAWLALKDYNPIWLGPHNPGIDLYPSFLVPANLPPPYGAVHIEPTGTEYIQGTPLNALTDYSAMMLTSDMVRVTLYGCTNDQAFAFLQLVNSYSRDTGIIGIMDPAVIRDEKRTQTELSILAMKKTLSFKISYNQMSMDQQARQLILIALATVIPQPF